ncbi:MAG: L-threonylcarbamoyladenylate synthase [Candidatus Pacebacteria bacterium]|nr:L-threonylcarbamoyladenylate synthase [Candidatus Paceibacterota bacterium]MDD4897217.1 L-threonylcarbamoyladenylate synthase [Candidatus Paceibacterota bacterium]
MNVLKLSKGSLNAAVYAIKKGEVIICPTDTVYGLLSSTKNKKAVNKIFKIKSRKKEKPLPVFVGSMKMAKELAFITKKQEKFLKKNWPGKTTAILKAKKDFPLLSKNGTIALRYPNYKFIVNIIRRIKGPLAQTSANISGKPALNKVSDIVKTFEKKKIRPSIIIDGGDFKKGRPSSIVDLTKDSIKTLR